MPFDWNGARYLLRKGGPSIDWLHQQIKRYNKNRVVPGTGRVGPTSLFLERRVPLRLRLVEALQLRKGPLQKVGDFEHPGDGTPKGTPLSQLLPPLLSQSPCENDRQVIIVGISLALPLWALCYGFTSSKPHSNPLL